MNKLTFITRLLPACGLLCSLAANSAPANTTMRTSDNDTTHIRIRPYADSPESFEGWGTVSYTHLTLPTILLV